MSSIVTSGSLRAGRRLSLASNLVLALLAGLAVPVQAQTPAAPVPAHSAVDAALNAATNPSANPTIETLPDPVPPGIDTPGPSGRRAPAVARPTPLSIATQQRREGKPADALRTLDEGLAATPRDARMRFLYGVLLSETSRPDDAIEVFRQLTEDFPELPEPWNNLAVLLAGQGRLEAARASLESALRVTPGYALAHENLGDVLLRLAQRAWETAGSLDPKNASAPRKAAQARELLKN